MQELAEKISEAIKKIFPESYVTATYVNGVCEAITIRFAYQPKEKWYNGIFHNADYNMSHVWNVKESGAVLQKGQTGLFSYEYGNGRLKTRAKSKVNADAIVKHIAREFEKLKLGIESGAITLKGN